MSATLGEAACNREILSENYRKHSLEINESDQNTAKRLLKEKCLNECKEEQALVDAAFEGDCERIAELFSSGVSLEAKNFNKNLHYFREHLLIPLHLATANEHVECVQMLINYRADVNVKDEFNSTALHLAAENGNYPCLIALLEAGADCNVPIVETSVYKTKAPYCGGTTALHLASRYNHVSCVKGLINFGADYNAVDANGHTSLFIATKAGYSKCVITHIENAHARAILSLPCYKFCNTPLHWAVDNRMLDCVQELVRLGCDVNYINEQGYSPLHLLCRTNHGQSSKRYIDFEILKCLVLNGYNIDINVKTDKGFTALYYCVFENYNPKNIIFLILHGANLNIKQKVTGITPLEYELICEKSLKVLKYLVKCMPQAPHLKSLNVYSTCFSLPGDLNDEKKILQASDLPENVGFKLIRSQTDIYVEIMDRALLMREIVDKSYLININSPGSRCAQYRLQQPLLDIVYERVLDELKDFSSTFKKYIDAYDTTDTEARFYYYDTLHFHLLKLKKQLWYEKVASNPCSLQQCCRYSVRKYMGHMDLKYIEKLPLPEKLKSFLMFNYKKSQL